MMSRRYTESELQDLLAAGIAVSNAMRDQLHAELNRANELLARCQEELHPHANAVLWGDVCDHLARRRGSP